MRPMELLRRRSLARSGTTSRAAERERAGWPVPLLLGLLAFIPRGVLQGTFLTVDEAYNWFARSEKFLAALRSGDYVHTIFVGHPGVTTTWLGAAGLLTHEWLARAGMVAPQDPDIRRMLMRLPVAVVTAVCLALAYPLLRRLFGFKVALLAGLLWAFDPFLVAHSKVLHTDALLTSFTIVSLLSALVAFRFDESVAPRAHTVRWPMLIASGVAGGLAVLTKTPALILLPLIALIAWSARHLDYVRGGRLMILPVAAWATTVIVCWGLLWPAAWIAPRQAVAAMYQEAKENGGSPHEKGSFFLGNAVADPGPLFYPVAIAFRLTPWVCLGLGGALVAALRRRSTLPNRPALWVLVVFVLLFATIMTGLPKTFDRYLLPIFPVLDLCAEIGLVWLAGLIGRWANAGATPRSRPATAAWIIAAIVPAANLAWYHPYELAYYNPLLGGGAVASRTVPVGWGEGYEAAGAYLAAQPDACTTPAAVEFHPLLAPYTCNPLIELDASDTSPFQHYTVLYRDQIQRGNAQKVTTSLMNGQRPVYVVQEHGIEYAYIYDVPPYVEHPVNADWGQGLRLLGYNIAAEEARKQGVLTVTWQWQAASPPPEHIVLFEHIIGAAGERLTQLDLPLAGAPPNGVNWRPGRATVWTQVLPIPKDAPADQYWLAIGLYDARNGRRLPVNAPAARDAPGDGEHAILLGPFRMP